MANERALACPNPDRSRDRPLEELDAALGVGDEVPGDEVDEVGGPIGIPLYSATGNEDWSVVNERLFLTSKASRTLTMAWRCSVKLSCAI